MPLLQTVDGVMSSALCPLAEHFRSSAMQATCDGCQSIISLHSGVSIVSIHSSVSIISLHSGMSIISLHSPSLQHVHHFPSLQCAQGCTCTGVSTIGCTDFLLDGRFCFVTVICFTWAFTLLPRHEVVLVETCVQ